MLSASVCAAIWLAIAAAQAVPSARTAAARETTYRTGVPALDRLQPLLRETLDANRKAFAGRTGPVHGFGAGTHYPQVWLRDSATVIPLARYHHSRAHLVSWLEEHLAHQNADGSLQDWVAAAGPARFQADAPRARLLYGAGRLLLSGDRNTSAADQESSAVDAAHQAFRILGDRAWLARPIAGRPLLQRLDAALRFVADRRMKNGLVTAAFTADWGDVSPVYGDQRVIYLDDATPVVGSLYASAMFVRAAKGLADLHRAAGAGARADEWQRQADTVTGAVTSRLWDEGRGFFRIHELLSAPSGWTAPRDEDIFALGGNTLAVLAGIADDARVSRIVAAAEARRRQYGTASIGGVLLPPYPRGFFRHPILRDEYQYQNGGEWEWFAGRFVLAELQRGHAARGRAHLRELAQSAVGRGGLFEWTTRDGRGMGSARYAGSAGAVGAAVFEGLFGLDLRADGLDVTVRLGPEPGEVHVQQSATGSSASYRYRFHERSRTATLDYQSTAPGRGTLAVLVPGAGVRVLARLDGRPLPPPAIRTIGRDRYAAIETDWAPHRLELTIR